MLRALAVVGIASNLSWPATRKLFEYDQAAPLHFQKVVEQPSSGVRLSEIEYDSPRGGRVTGYLIEPPHTRRSAGVVFGHWGDGNLEKILI